MPTYTILTTHGTITVDGDHWARSDAGVHVYPDDDGSDPVAEVDNDEFVGIVADGGSATFAPIDPRAAMNARDLRRVRTSSNLTVEDIDTTTD